jgi:hypothetical protein
MRHVDASTTGGREDKLRISMSGPIASKDFQGVLREGDITIFGPLATADVNEHPGAVDVGDLKVGAFLEAQPA